LADDEWTLKPLVEHARHRYLRRVLAHEDKVSDLKRDHTNILSHVTLPHDLSFNLIKMRSEPGGNLPPRPEQVTSPLVD
jgi:hypothetical protein